MKEMEFLNVIHKNLDDTSYLGDDCAYLKEFGLYVTHDSLVEGVHFSLETTTAYDLGWKAAAVNLSDLAAAGAKPLYLTISLSLPEKTESHFVEEFYRGINDICVKYNVKVIGGDLTGSGQVFISICAIGKKISTFDVSRKFAKVGDFVVVTGEHGNSAGGLRLLSRGEDFPKCLIESHLKPVPQIDKSAEIILNTQKDMAMMDTSDGLADALFKLAEASSVTFDIDFEKIPVSKELKTIFADSYGNLVLWGGEDFELLFCADKNLFDKLDKTKFFEIGRVAEKVQGASVRIKNEENTFFINEESFNENSFNHFEEK